VALELFSSIPMPDGGILTWAGWQGVAGIAQIIAGVLALVTVLQSTSMMREASRQRREAEKLRDEAVAPHWQVFPQVGKRLTSGQRICSSSLHFLNDGFGSAQKVDQVYYSAGSGKVISCTGIGDRADGKVILPGDLYMLNLEWEVDHRLDGRLFLESVTRVGTKIKHEFKVKTFLRDLTPVIEAELVIRAA